MIQAVRTIGDSRLDEMIDDDRHGDSARSARSASHVPGSPISARSSLPVFIRRWLSYSLLAATGSVVPDSETKPDPANAATGISSSDASVVLSRSLRRARARTELADAVGHDRVSMPYVDACTTRAIDTERAHHLLELRDRCGSGVYVRPSQNGWRFGSLGCARHSPCARGTETYLRARLRRGGCASPRCDTIPTHRTAIADEPCVV